MYVSLVEINDSVCLVNFLGNSPQVLKSYHSEWFKNRAGSCHSVQRLSNRKPIQWQTDEFLLQSNFKGHQRPLYLVHPLRSLTRTPCKYLEILKSEILQARLIDYSYIWQAYLCEACYRLYFTQLIILLYTSYNITIVYLLKHWYLP